MIYLTKQSIITFNFDESILDELKIFCASLDVLAEKLNGKIDWFNEVREEAKRTLEDRIRAEKKRELRKLKALQETDLTMDERKDKRTKRITELEKELS